MSQFFKSNKFKDQHTCMHGHVQGGGNGAASPPLKKISWGINKGNKGGKREKYERKKEERGKKGTMYLP